MHENYKKLDANIKEKIKKLEKWNKELIQQIENIKTNKNYKPEKILYKLFKEFFWDKNVFNMKKNIIDGK